MQMEIPKAEGRDEDIFMDYIVKKGTLLYKNEDDSEPKHIKEKEFKINLGDADYDPDSFVDPEILELIEADDDEKYDEDYVETEVTVNGYNEAQIDASVLGDEDAVAYQNFFSFYESNTIIDMDDEITFYFEADLPETNLKTGVIVAQIVTLVPTDTSNTNQWSVGCFVQVGN